MTRGTAPACGRQSPLPRHLVSPLGAQFPRPLPVARRALLGTRPRPPARPTALERSLRPPSFVLRFLLSLLYPASCFLVCLPETRIARQVGACTTPAPKHRESPPPDAAAAHAAVHPTRAKAAGRGRRGRRGPRSCSAGSPRIRRLRLGVRAWAGRGRGRGSPPAGEVVARSPEPERPGPESGLAAGWGLVSLQQEGARP